MADAKWDGMERRVGAERRKGQQVPFQEYPKMVDGVVMQNADHEAAGAKALKEAKSAEAPPTQRKPFALSAEDADGTAARMAQPGDQVPGDLTSSHPAVSADTPSDKAKAEKADANERYKFDTRAPRSARKK